MQRDPSQRSLGIRKSGNERPKPLTDIDESNKQLQDDIWRAHQATVDVAETPKAEQKLDTFESRTSSEYITAGQKFIADNSSTATATSKQVGHTIASAPEIKGLEDGVRGFVESSRYLMSILDELSKLHPFIGVAVLSFKAVIALELKRRDNNQKVILLKVQMKDMMSTLLQLRLIKNSQQMDQDGMTLEGRMRTLMEAIAHDITACGNACDAYSKSHIVVKVLKGPVWEPRLAEFAVIFDNRRKEIEHVLAFHTAFGVDSANRSLDVVQKDIQAMDVKLENMLQLFHRLDSPFERELTKVVTARGGAQACIDDDATLKELAIITTTKDLSFVSTNRTSSGKLRSGSVMPDPFLFSSLRHELGTDIEDSLASNMVQFERKLEVQKRQLVKEIEDLVQREGDRVISAVTSGPHDKVLDADLHSIWKEMGWKGSVKARHFVLALYDYFNEKYRDPDLSELESPMASPSPADSMVSGQSSDFGSALSKALSNTSGNRKGDDQWALAYINILRAQALLEAFDDHATGFVTVKEANAFTSSRPRDWSLAHWMAFWAAGWHYSVWHYRAKIGRIIMRMWDSLEDVLPFNRGIVDMYLGSGPFCRIELLLRSVTPYHGENDGDLWEKIRPYVMEEEARIKDNLTAIRFDIDAPSTLSLVTGPGRIERYLFPLLYLLLQQHLRVIQIASQVILSDAELHRAIDLRFVFNAIDERIATLIAVFQQKGLDDKVQLSSFAFGMFKLLHCPDLIDSLHNKDTGNDSGYEDEETVQSAHDLGILKYGTQDEEMERIAYDVPVSGSSIHTLDVAPDGPRSMKGIWAGLNFYDGQTSTDGLTEIEVYDTSDDGSFRGRGIDGLGSFTIRGKIQDRASHERKVKFTKAFDRFQYGVKTIWFYKGRLDARSDSIDGRWQVEKPRRHYGDFHLDRTPAFTHQFRLSPEQLAKNLARARWSFAGAAILHLVRRRLWSWSYFKHRRMQRKHFLDLFKRRELTRVWHLPADELTKEEEAELLVLERALTPPDGYFYHSRGKAENRKLCIHFNASCDVCAATIIGSRNMCLVCASKRDEINLCSGCIHRATARRNFVHEPTHGIIKVPYVVHHREKAWLNQSAKEKANETKAIFSGSDSKGRRGQLHEADESSISDNIPNFERYCRCCGLAVTIPCWACIYCEINVFICDDCVSKQSSCSYQSHSDKHPLVRCVWPNAVSTDVKTLESRMLELEAKVEGHQKELNLRLDQLEKRLVGQDGFMTTVHLESSVESRLRRMEDLLIRMDEKFGA